MSQEVLQWLKATQPGRWRGCGGPIAWLLQLPCVTDMDFNIGTLQGAHLGFRSQGYRPSRGKILLAAVKVVDFKVLRRV
jgi:hypothetical protein